MEHTSKTMGREFLMRKTLLDNQDIVLSGDTFLNKVCGCVIKSERKEEE